MQTLCWSPGLLQAKQLSHSVALVSRSSEAKLSKWKLGIKIDHWGKESNELDM